MRRVFWVGVGAVVAAVVVVRGREVLRRFTPEGVVEQVEGQVTGLADQARTALATFSAASKEREAELTEALLGEADVSEARRVRKESKARKAWDFDEDPARQDEDDSLGYSFF